MAITFVNDITSPAPGYNDQWFEFSSSTANPTVCEIDITAPSFTSSVKIFPNSSGVFTWNPIDFVKAAFKYIDNANPVTGTIVEGHFNDDFNIDFMIGNTVDPYDDTNLYKSIQFDFTVSFTGSPDETASKTIVFLKDVAQYGESLTYTTGNSTTGRLMSSLLVFDGYPFEFSYWDGSSIQRQLVSDGPNFDGSFGIESLKNSGGVYLKWLSKAGYSYWLFDCENQEQTTSRSIGVIDQSFSSFNENVGLGNDLTREKTLHTVVQNEYWPTFETLLNSPEVYLYTGDKDIAVDWSTDFQRVSLTRFNGSTVNTKSAYRVVTIGLNMPNPKTITLI